MSSCWTPGGAAHHRCGNWLSWWPRSQNVTNTLLSRTNQVGAPWLGRSVTSGRAVQMARRRSRGRSPALASSSRAVSLVAAVAQVCLSPGRQAVADLQAEGEAELLELADVALERRD